MRSIDGTDVWNTGRFFRSPSCDSTLAAAGVDGHGPHQDHRNLVNRDLGALVNIVNARNTPADALKPGVSTQPQASRSPSNAEIRFSANLRHETARQELSARHDARIIAMLLASKGSMGAEKVLDACLAVSTAERLCDAKPGGASAIERKSIQAVRTSIDKYLKAADGNFSGAYRIFRGDGSSELKSLDADIENLLGRFGGTAVKRDLHVQLAPALLHTLQAKGWELSVDALVDSLSPAGLAGLKNETDLCFEAMLRCTKDLICLVNPKPSAPDQLPDAERSVPPTGGASSSPSARPTELHIHFHGNFGPANPSASPVISPVFSPTMNPVFNNRGDAPPSSAERGHGEPSTHRSESSALHDGHFPPDDQGHADIRKDASGFNGADEMSPFSDDFGDEQTTRITSERNPRNEIPLVSDELVYAGLLADSPASNRSGETHSLFDDFSYTGILTGPTSPRGPGEMSLSSDDFDHVYPTRHQRTPDGHGNGWPLAADDPARAYGSRPHTAETRAGVPVRAIHPLATLVEDSGADTQSEPDTDIDDATDSRRSWVATMVERLNNMEIRLPTDNRGNAETATTSYLGKINPGLRTTTTAGGGARFTLNMDSFRHNVRAPEDAPREEHDLTRYDDDGKLTRGPVASVRVERHKELVAEEINHRGRGAELGKVIINRPDRVR